MNWNSNEFLWLDWVVLAVGVIAIVWAVPTLRTICSVKASPGT